MLLLISCVVIQVANVIALKVQKFCPEFQVYFTQNKTCVTANLTVKDFLLLPKNTEVITGKLSCDVIELSPEVDGSFNFSIAGNGRLVVPIRRWEVDAENYLVEVFYDGVRYFKKAFYCSEHLIQLEVTEDLNVVRKCCGVSEMLLISPDIAYQAQCIPRSSIFHDSVAKLQSNSSAVVVRFCETEEFSETDEFDVLEKGFVRLNDGEVLNPSQYCIDDVVGGFVPKTIFPKLVLVRCSQLDSSIKQTKSYVSDVTELTTFYAETVTEQSQKSLSHAPACCPRGLLMNKQGGCTEADLPLPLRIYLTRWLGIKTEGIEDSTDTTGMSLSLLPCNNTKYSTLAPVTITDDTEQTIKIHNGTLTVVLAPPGCPHIGKQIHIRRYCVAPTITGVQQPPYGLFFHYCEEEEGLAALRRDVSLVYPTMIFCSTFCLAMAVVVYVIAPPQVQVSTMISTGSKSSRRKKTQRLVSTLFGKLLVFHMGSLLLGFLSLGLVQVGSVKAGQKGCTFMALWIYLSFTSAFAWLSVLCFELWWQFRETKASNDKRLIPYSVFGFGFPTMMTTLAATADLWSSSCDVRPHFNFDRCWFYGDRSLLIFFYGPISILVILNVVFFVLMVFNLGICDCFSTTKISSVQESSNRSNKVKKTKVLLAAKLFIVMGIPWITEIVAWATGYYKTRDRQASIDAWYWYVANTLNASRGIQVLLIFVVTKRHIRRFFLMKVGNILKKAQPADRTTSSVDNSKTKQSISEEKRSHNAVERPSDSDGSGIESTLNGRGCDNIFYSKSTICEISRAESLTESNGQVMLQLQENGSSINDTVTAEREILEDAQENSSV